MGYANAACVEELIVVGWQKSSRSQGYANCVEVGVSWIVQAQT